MTERITISAIVDSNYCEQRVALEQRHGRLASAETRQRRAEGVRVHAQLAQRTALTGELAAAGQGATGDRRCFIATAVYGADAAQTQTLRMWRDRVLLPSRAGRLVVAAYYAVSPWIVRRTQGRPRAIGLFRAVLDALVRRVERRRAGGA